MKSRLTFNKLEIVLSKLNLERSKKLAKQMVSDNDYLFIIDNYIIYKGIDKLNNKELLGLFKEFDNIGILDEYVIDIDSNNVNIYSSKDSIFNNINKENQPIKEANTIFIKILSIIIPILLIIMYMIFIFYNNK